MEDSCYHILFAASGLIGAIGFYRLCRSMAKYFDRAATPERIDLGIGVAWKDFLKIQLGIRGEKTPDSEKGHPASDDDGLSRN